ncbi:FAD-dependent monooxygenase [Amycolatopsis mongoliensis]|uniref:FAD-dependent monooxygenase n=1 Tax=Amycolatopsis mongoliensis TaxID=715475 RepID=A0A9Y2NMS5_9PSEU|nr:FAD-dependent monooxygenase [Amycolatopsis sp. 4-36]WIY07499.1 FAD-dependent monooxygenase [Amycolatopsis sp. 4-36]
MNSARRALVSGASVSGLTTAYWLTRYGFDVTVVEVSSQLRPGGHALDVRGPGLEVAERMGIAETLRDRATNLAGIAMVDASGRETFRSTQSTLTGGQLDSPDIEIMRDDLCRALHEAAGDSVEYIFGDRITSLVQDESGVDVTFTEAGSRRFELVIGADGVGSGVRRIAFGPDERFLRVFGDMHIAVFSTPNFLGLDRWEVIYHQDEPYLGALVMGLREDAPAKVYLGFSDPAGTDYDLGDVDGQKRLMAERVADGGWVIPQLVNHMMDAGDFHFYRLSQVRMDSWSRGRVVLVGDAGYAVSAGTGQATSVAMLGAYVLAGELATHRDDVVGGMNVYENELRDYVTRNQDIALEYDSKPRTPSGRESSETDPGGLPDYGSLTLPFSLKDYPALVRP